MPSPTTCSIKEQEEHLNHGVLRGSSGQSQETSSETTEQHISSPSTPNKNTLGSLTNNLPLEILAEILRWCTPAFDDQESYEPYAALKLSQVCSHWRKVALTSPQLWTYMKIKIPQQVMYPALDLMGLYLERSKLLPVFIDVDFVDRWSYYKPVLDLFEQIVSKAREYRPVESIADSFLATHIEASSTEHKPTREEWYFWSARPVLSFPEGASDTGSYFDLANTSASSQSTKALVTIRALRVAVGSFVPEPYLPFASSLTFLILRDMHDFTQLTVDGAAFILRCFPLLVHCSLYIDYESAGPNRRQLESIDLAFLKSFSLAWGDWVNIGPLLDVLSAPSLRELELAGRLPETDHGGEWTHLIEFQRRNDAPLTHLIFDQIDCFHIDFLSLLPLTPNLEGLWLEDCLLDESIIHGLGPVLGPAGQLKTLVLLECYAFNIEALTKVLKDTEHPGKTKVKVYVDGCGDLSPVHIEMIQGMGLNNLEIGPSSMPVDLEAFEFSESDLEVNEV